MNTGTSMGGTDRPSEDRLPWLESAEEERRTRSGGGRILALILLLVLLIGAAVLAVSWMREHRSLDGSGELIVPPPGDYKVPPDEPGGMKVDGEGSTVFSTSEGGASNSAVDLTKIPEAPVAGKAATSAKPADKGSAKVVAELPASGGQLAAQAPATLAPRGGANAGGGGSVVQLGSFPSEGGANTAWATLSKRFAYLAALGKHVEPAEVNGETVYRLRVNTGSAGNARSICGRLKIAGEACFIPN